MSQRLIIPHDVEDVLQQDLSTAASAASFVIGVSATPVPKNLGTTLPFAVVYDVGGFRSSPTVDTHAVSIDVYAERWALAMRAANKLAAILASFEDRSDLSQDYLTTALTSLPYNNPDPDHPDIPRVTFTADVVLSAVVI